MKILIHSNAPMVPSGYGNQTRLLIPRLQNAGHEVAVSCLYGLAGSPIKHGGVAMFPAGRIDHSPDVICGHADTWGADVIMPIMDYYRLYPAASELAKRTVVPWLPVDCYPVSYADQITLRESKATPVAMSRFGVKQLHEMGLEKVPYVPHCYDRTEFFPVDDREELRKQLGVDDRFVIGMCAANHDALRKGFIEQLWAFKRFQNKHKDALLFLHTMMDTTPRGLDLNTVIHDLDIPPASIMPSDQYAQTAGLMSPDIMRGWFSSLDVLSNASYGEGFGIPIIEAAACGTPAVVTDCSSMTELAGAGWKVKGEEFWNFVHRAWWTRPSSNDILMQYEKAYQEAGGKVSQERRQRAIQFARQFEADKVFSERWIPVLKTLD